MRQLHAVWWALRDFIRLNCRPKTCHCPSSPHRVFSGAFKFRFWHFSGVFCPAKRTWPWCQTVIRIPVCFSVGFIVWSGRFFLAGKNDQFLTFFFAIVVYRGKNDVGEAIDCIIIVRVKPCIEGTWQRHTLELTSCMPIGEFFGRSKRPGKLLRRFVAGFNRRGPVRMALPTRSGRRCCIGMTRSDDTMEKEEKNWFSSPPSPRGCCDHLRRPWDEKEGQTEAIWRPGKKISFRLSLPAGCLSCKFQSPRICLSIVLPLVYRFLSLSTQCLSTCLPGCLSLHGISVSLSTRLSISPWNVCLLVYLERKSCLTRHISPSDEKQVKFSVFAHSFAPGSRRETFRVTEWGGGG